MIVSMVRLGYSDIGHLQRMEARIEQQRLDIDRIKQQGGDTSEMLRQMEARQTELDELRAKLGAFSSAETDTKASDIEAALRALAERR
jgi:hypothetical protein